VSTTPAPTADARAALEAAKYRASKRTEPVVPVRAGFGTTAIVVTAFVLFAITFAARLVIDDPGALIANFYTVPIALLAIAFGQRAGLAAAAFALGLVFAWAAIDSIHVSVLGYTARGAAFLVVGWLVGGYADRLRSDIAARRRAQVELSLYAEEVEQANERLAFSVRRLDAFAQIARAAGGEADAARIIDHILAQGRAILPSCELDVVLHGAGRDASIGAPASAESGRPADAERVTIRSPLVFRGETLGVLEVRGRTALDADDVALADAIAASTATALATARSIESDRLRLSIEAAERARAGWARELHDQTLQGLAGVSMLLSTALDARDPSGLRRAAESARTGVANEVTSLRDLIAELRPAVLDDLGLGPAIETLTEHHSPAGAPPVSLVVELGAERLDPELERTVYRIVQEALNNVAKHAGTCCVSVAVVREGTHVVIEVRDDGCGFDPGASAAGFGLIGMRERALLAGGLLSVESRAGRGTVVRAEMPVRG